MKMYVNDVLYLIEKLCSQGVTMPIFTLLGLIGNVLSILVLRSPGIDMKVSPHLPLLLPFALFVLILLRFLKKIHKMH